jgi:hypothetical protein
MVKYGKFSGRLQAYCHKCWLMTKPKTDRHSVIKYLAERKCDAGLKAKIEKLGKCLEEMLIE